MTKFSKEQNELKMKEVSCLNYSSTFEEMIKSYRSMARRFQPDKNIGLDTTVMMKMINTAKFGFLDLLRDNYQMREEENVQAAEDEESIPSDHYSESESSRT